MADEPKGPELVSMRELARRLVAEGVVPSISHQRVNKLAKDDPDFPPVVLVGTAKAVDWHAAVPYFLNRRSRQGQRTDLLKGRDNPGDSGHA